MLTLRDVKNIKKKVSGLNLLLVWTTFGLPLGNVCVN